MTVKLIYRKIIGITLGALGGYAYYHYIGCWSGHCPISSNPWISTLYGAMMGFLIASMNGKTTGMPSTTKEKKQ